MDRVSPRVVIASTVKNCEQGGRLSTRQVRDDVGVETRVVGAELFTKEVGGLRCPLEPSGEPGRRGE